MIAPLPRTCRAICMAISGNTLPAGRPAMPIGGCIPAVLWPGLIMFCDEKGSAGCCGRCVQWGIRYHRNLERFRWGTCVPGLLVPKLPGLRPSRHLRVTSALPNDIATRRRRATRPAASAGHLNRSWPDGGDRADRGPAAGRRTGRDRAGRDVTGLDPAGRDLACLARAGQAGCGRRQKRRPVPAGPPGRRPFWRPVHSWISVAGEAVLTNPNT
jgi:hypothetical protein